jgi:autotransporter-associated beta strand protein
MQIPTSSASGTYNRTLVVGGVEFSGPTGGTGVMNINTSGTVNALFRLIIGEQGTGTVNLDNGTINIGNDFTVGFRTNGAVSGNGTFNMSGGTVNRTGGWTTFGRDGTSQGHFNMSGGIMNAVGQTIVGLNAATGTFTMSGGTYNAGEIHVGRENNSQGQFSMSNGIMNVGGQTIIGLNNATGTFTMTGGTYNAGEIFFGNSNNANSTATISAGTVNVNSWLVVGRDNSNGTLTISGTADVHQGLTDAGASLEMTNFNAGGTATVNLDGGNLTVNRVEHSGGGGATTTFNFNGGTLKARTSAGNFMGGLTSANVRDGGAKIDTNGFDVTVAQALQHSSISGDAATDGGLTKAGNGTLTLSGTSSYTGSTEIDAGALLLTGALTATSAVNVDSGATLGGNGTINSAATVSIADGGTLSPGLSPGILNTGSVSIAAGGDLKLEINGSVLGIDYDNLNVTGSVSLGGADLLVTLGAGFAPTIGETFTVVSNDLADPILGLFGSINGGAFGGGDTFSLTNDQGTFDFVLHYDGDGPATSGGNDVVIETVPEPGVIVSLLGGVSVLLGLRRRRM